VHPETLPAERILNGRQLCAWVRAAGDAVLENDTSCRELTGIGTSVSEISGLRPQAYPNPLQDVLYFKQLPAGSVLRIYDAHGRCLTRLSESPESFVIPQDWPAGLYFLQIQDKNTLHTIPLQRP
jgi:hypothetical protein